MVPCDSKIDGPNFTHPSGRLMKIDEDLKELAVWVPGESGLGTVCTS